jgi:16S rRNA G966 N2-methylase RsmD
MGRLSMLDTIFYLLHRLESFLLDVYNERMRNGIIQTRGYDQNIAGDELSLKIASYPSTARYLAERLKHKGDTVCELCCGIGISLLELSKSFNKVIGVDNDPNIITDCKQNLTLASIENYELLCGDVSDRDLLAKIKADAVLYDIPYWSSHEGRVDPERQNPNLKQLIADITEAITSNIVIYAPTHLTYESAKDTLGDCEYVEVYTNGKHDRNFIFLGGLIENDGRSRVEV